MSLGRLLGFERAEYPLRLGERIVDSRPIKSGFSFQNPGSYAASTPTVQIGPVAKGFLLAIGLFFLIPLILLLLIFAVADPAFAGVFVVLGVIIILGLITYFGIKHLGPSGGTYLVTTWRALILDRNNIVVQGYYLKDVVPISHAYTMTHGNVGSHPKGDMDFQSSTDASFLMKFANIDYPEELEKKIKIAQGSRLALCKSCGLPMMSVNANYCGACGTKQA